MMCLREFSNDPPYLADNFQQSREVTKMTKQDSKTQEQKAQTNNDINKGENDMTETIETVETRELEDQVTETENNETIDQEAEVAEEVDIITDMDETQPAQTEEKEGYTWDLAMTDDSTSLSEITNIIVEGDVGNLGDSDLLDRLDAFLGGEIKFRSNKDKLQAGQELLREFFAEHNRAWSGIVGTFTDYAVQIGRLLLALKSLVKACGLMWEPWTAENLKFMTPRTRQRNMQLAKVRGIDNHLHFGVERLLLLDAATKGNDGDDPIGDFLAKYNLGFDPAEEIDLDAYKDAVDLALDHQRLTKADIDVDMESLKKFKADGKKIGAGLIDTLKIVQQVGGDPNDYLRAPHDDDDDTIDGQKKAQSFQKIATTLAGTIDWLSSHEEYAKDVDVAKIDELATKLAELRNLVAASESPEDDD
jgi:hypothetical protein